MASCNTEYFVGNGVVYVKPYGSTTEGWTQVGDTQRFAIEISQDFIDIYESCTGNRNIAAHVVNQTDWNFVVETLSFSKANLARALYGTPSAVVGGTVTGEDAVFGAVGDAYFTKHPGISAVVVKQASTTLTLNTDYTVDAGTGVITLISAANLTGSAPYTLDVDYTYAGYDKVAGGTQIMKDYSFKLAGINKVTGKNVVVTIPRVALNMSEATEFLGTDTAVFSMGGMVLPDGSAAVGDSQYVTIQKVA